MLLFLFPQLFEFPFYPHSLSYILCKTHRLLFCILLLCCSFCPSSPPPLSSFYSSASACSCSIFWFCFMLSLSLSPTTPPTTPETELVYSAFPTSRLCAAVTVIFLSNICFFHLQIFFFHSSPYSYHHRRTPHSFLEILNCFFSNLAPGHFKSCHL